MGQSGSNNTIIDTLSDQVLILISQHLPEQLGRLV